MWHFVFLMVYTSTSQTICHKQLLGVLQEI